MIYNQELFCQMALCLKPLAWAKMKVARDPKRKKHISTRIRERQRCVEVNPDEQNYVDMKESSDQEKV